MEATIAIIVSVLAVGVGLATLMITMIRGLRRDMGARMDGLDKRMDGLDKRMDGLDARMDGLDARVRTLESALARLTGLLEGLGLTGRARPEPDPGPAD